MAGHFGPMGDTFSLIPSAAWLEMLPASVVVIAGDVLRYANPAALRLMEAEAPEDLIGRPVADFIHPLDLHRIMARIRRAERNDGANPPTEARAFSCRARPLIVAITSTPLEMAGTVGVLAALMDMSERAAMEARLRETDENFQRIMNTMQDVFYRTDAQGITRYVCPAVKNVLGYSAEEIIGRSAADFYPDPADREALVAAIRRHGFVHDFPGQMRRKDGQIIDISISTQALKDEQGNYAGVEGIWRDITERKKMERELERLATRDALTGVLNRRCVLERLEVVMAQRRDERRRPPLSVLLLDLDHFKAVNDSHGHGVGDLALCRFAQVVNEQRRAADQFGRVGGEEFLLILEDADTDAALRVAERIRRAFEASPLPLAEGAQLHLTVSIGVATRRTGDQRTGDLLERADEALYQAKNTGRNRVCT